LRSAIETTALDEPEPDEPEEADDEPPAPAPPLVDEPVELDEPRQLTTYRLVQESLTNVGKYAEAKTVDVALRNYSNHVEVEVRDDGKGFDPARMRPSTHGLAGMRHRVEAAGGRFMVESRPGEGTRISATLPKAPRTDTA